MNLCFSTFVYGWYQDFIPIYIYSILTAFPQHHVKIFLHEQLSETNKYCLSLIPSDNFEIVENFKELDSCNIQHLSAYRFLLTRDHFKDFDYIYMGDVDFLIYNQFNDNFYDFYVSHCKKTKLPFSNEWNYDFGKYRMTGLHFMIKDPYFDQMDSWIENMKRGTNNFKTQSPQSPSLDEEMLHYMTFHAFDLRPLIGYRRPYHGLHFGIFKNIENSISFKYKNRIDQWINDKEKINDVLNSDLFKTFLQFMDPKAKRTVKIAQSTMKKIM